MNTTTFGLSSTSIWRVLSVFLFFSAADLYLTWQLIDQHQDAGVGESNPIAATVLHSYGWGGMALYKFGLVMLFFIVALIVERRRPLGGLFLLLFACGVQASVVASSTFLLYEVRTRPVEPDMVVVTPGFHDVNANSLPTGSVALLGQRTVQTELRVSADQRNAISQLIKSRRDLSRDLQTGSLDGWRNRLSFLVMNEDTLVRSLSDTQVKRLQQLTWQHRGPLALGDQEVIDTLRLNSRQIDDVLNVLDKAPPQDRPVRKKSAADELEQVKSQLWAVLSSEQKDKWHAMIGMPFAFEATAAIRARAWDAVLAAE